MAKIAIVVLAIVGGVCLLMATGACLLGAYWALVGAEVNPAAGAAFLCAIPGTFSVSAAVMFGLELDWERNQ